MSEEILAGGIVFQRKDGDYQIALVRDIFGYWTFPKGHLEKRENLEQTILREIQEEIGLTNLTIVKNLGERIYKARDRVKGGYIKRKVTDFLLESTGDVELKVEESPGIKEAKWFSLDEIPSLRQYKETKEILQKIIEHFKKYTK